jgi:hypothetical protein
MIFWIKVEFTIHILGQYSLHKDFVSVASHYKGVFTPFFYCRNLIDKIQKK